MVSQSTIYRAAYLKNKKIVQFLIDNYYDQIDIDYFLDQEKQSARNLILRYRLYEGKLPEKTKCAYHKLYKALMTLNITEFIELYNEEKTMPLEVKIILLQRALCFGATEIFEYLLLQVKDLISFSGFVEAACLRGFYKIVDCLLHTKYMDYRLNFIMGIVTVPLVKENVTKDKSHVKCLEMVLEYYSKTEYSQDLMLNVPDAEGNTVLQYAIIYRNPKIIHVLLAYGASLLTRKGKGKL